jgi:hypothetical protein
MTPMAADAERASTEVLLRRVLDQHRGHQLLRPCQLRPAGPNVIQLFTAVIYKCSQ